MISRSLQPQTSILARSCWRCWGTNSYGYLAGQSWREHWFSRQVGRLDLRKFEMGQVESVAFTDDQELMIISEPGARFLVRWKRRKSEPESK